MDNAANAVSKLFAKGPATDDSEAEKVTNSSSSSAAPPTSTDRDVDTTVDSEVEPAVEHTHVKKQHETREQTFVEKEKHQDHYHTTIQPLKDSEVLPEKHDHIQEVESAASTSRMAPQKLSRRLIELGSRAPVSKSSLNLRRKNRRKLRSMCIIISTRQCSR